MLYFSELKNKKIFTEDNIYLGKLKDVIFTASEDSSITKFVIKTKSNPKLIIPIESINNINNDIFIKKHFLHSDLAEDELYLTKNLLDNQIIDIKGEKIVRVNDVAIQDKPKFYISGVDIGILGILRWFKLDDYIIRLLRKFNINLTSNFLSWADIHPLELARGHVKIKKEQQKLEKIRPEDLADYLEKTNVSNISRILNIVDEKKATEIIKNLNINYQSELFRRFELIKAKKIISKIDPDEAVDILLTLSRNRRNQILKTLDKKTYDEINYLLNLSRTPIGSYITTDFLTVQSFEPTKDIIKKIQNQTREFFVLFYVYVLNEKNELVGVINLHELILQNPDTPVYKFMNQDLIVIHLNTPKVIVMRKFIKYKLYSLPIVDKNKKIIGIVTFDDIVESAMKYYG
jgi:CBS domain-containing protein/sporulation protein YlmC with PRC-barrel domain